MEGAYLGLGICHQLMGDGLDFAGLDVQSALKNVGGAKGANPGAGRPTRLQDSRFPRLSEICILVPYFYLRFFLHHAPNRRLCKAANQENGFSLSTAYQSLHPGGFFGILFPRPTRRENMGYFAAPPSID